MKEEADDYYNYAIMGFFVERQNETKEMDRRVREGKTCWSLATGSFIYPTDHLNGREIYTRVSSSRVELGSVPPRDIRLLHGFIYLVINEGRGLNVH